MHPDAHLPPHTAPQLSSSQCCRQRLAACCAHLLCQIHVERAVHVASWSWQRDVALLHSTRTVHVWELPPCTCPCPRSKAMAPAGAGGVAQPSCAPCAMQRVQVHTARLVTPACQGEARGSAIKLSMTCNEPPAGMAAAAARPACSACPGDILASSCRQLLCIGCTLIAVVHSGTVLWITPPSLLSLTQVKVSPGAITGCLPTTARQEARRGGGSDQRGWRAGECRPARRASTVRARRLDACCLAPAPLRPRTALSARHSTAAHPPGPDTS